MPAFTTSMSIKTLYTIRADFDTETIVVYQAFNHAIADAALASR
jgi:hypothetical protein